MDSVTNETKISALFEAFFACQKMLLNSLNQRDIPFTRHQFYTLFALAGKDAMSMGQVAESIAASREQATRVVAPLVEDGYVERFYDETNRKRVFVRLTEQGRSYVRKEQRQAREQLASRFERLSPRELERFLDNVSELKGILEKMEL